MILLPIKGFSVLTHSPFHIKLPFASSLVVAAITAGTVHLPEHRWAFQCPARSGQSLALFLLSYNLKTSARNCWLF